MSKGECNSAIHVELRGFRIFWLSGPVVLECLPGRHLLAWETYCVHYITYSYCCLDQEKKTNALTLTINNIKCFISTVCWEKKNCIIAMCHLSYVGYCDLFNSESNKAFAHNLPCIFHNNFSASPSFTTTPCTDPNGWFCSVICAVKIMHKHSSQIDLSILKCRETNNILRGMWANIIQAC